MSLHTFYTRIVGALHSRRGHDILVFLIFLGMSLVLWAVMSLNQEEQCDIRMPLKINHVPDSVTIISNPPQSISVSLRAHGSQLLKLNWGRVPTINIDFRLYRDGNTIRLSEAELKAITRSALDGASVLVTSPDSLTLAFTSAEPIAMPLTVDYNVSAGPQAIISGEPILSVDSVRVYSTSRLPVGLAAISTEPIQISGLNTSTTKRVRLVAPRNSRVIPDSVDVTFNVEPLILKTRRINIETVNVPARHKLITFPAQIDVMYMIPVGLYKTSEPRMRVIADYKTINRDNPTRMIRLKLVDVSANIQNVHLAADSAEYIIENL
jgi:hypothetical protein